MKTELSTLRAALRDHQFPSSEAQFTKAERILNKFHRKYGTVNPIVVESLIN
jgi:hypothetical protein